MEEDGGDDFVNSSSVAVSVVSSVNDLGRHVECQSFIYLLHKTFEQSKSTVYCYLCH